MNEVKLQNQYANFLFEYIRRKKKYCTDEEIRWDVKCVIKTFLEMENGLLNISKGFKSDSDYIKLVLVKIASKQIDLDLGEGYLSKYSAEIDNISVKTVESQNEQTNNGGSEDKRNLYKNDYLKLFSKSFLKMIEIQGKRKFFKTDYKQLNLRGDIKLHYLLIVKLHAMTNQSSKVQIHVRRKNVIILKIYYEHGPEQIATFLEENISNIKQDLSRWWKQEIETYDFNDYFEIAKVEYGIRKKDINDFKDFLKGK